jgi:hypothetical protein
MFCPSCGAENSGLKYCNHCGANLASLYGPSETTVVNLTKPAVLIGIILVVLTLGGFGLLVGGALALAPALNGSDPLMAMILFGMIVILTIDIFLVRQLTKLINAALRSDAGGVARSRIQNVQHPQSLPTPETAHFLPASSVTDNTTRFLEQASPRNRKEAPIVAEKRNQH